MNKVKLKIEDIIKLDAEINGVNNQQTGELISKGLMSEKLKLKIKYRLNDLNKKITAEKEVINNLRDEIILRLGINDGLGNVSIPIYINEIKDANGTVISADINPKYTEFQKEFNIFLQEEKEIEIYEFKLEDFGDIETEGSYLTFFNLITE
jgi:hypothetical protein